MEICGLCLVHNLAVEGVTDIDQLHGAVLTVDQGDGISFVDDIFGSAVVFDAIGEGEDVLGPVVVIAQVDRLGVYQLFDGGDVLLDGTGIAAPAGSDTQTTN